MHEINFLLNCNLWEAMRLKEIKGSNPLLTFIIPSLKEVVITLTQEQTSNAKKKSGMIESLLKYGNKLKKI
ncbi:hypothetical protein OSB04_030198 [Centaurea solstitialis]|uniref:Uncharacterized protein n=1 Tax=Centaurea solstitialis TaxID=347529 RepID=A0AA38S740_9ASTR|nr:hypothetical protein OSB04_030198 [Centaurea solstitialis]